MKNICLIHSMGLFGNKVGGLETYIRDFVTYCPNKYGLLFVGVATCSDDPVGVFYERQFNGRNVLLFNIMKAENDNISEASSNIFNSLTFRFLLGLIKYNRKLSKFIKNNNYMVDLRRVEFSFFCVFNGIKFTQMLHGVGVPAGDTSSLLLRFKFVHNLFERLAIKNCEYFFCVNKYKAEELKHKYPLFDDRIGYIGTWADKSIYKPIPFQLNNIIDLSFVGRLENVKDPKLMFDVIKIIKNKNKHVRLHYVGPDDPSKISGYSDIKDELIVYGYKTAKEISDILSCVDIGILFSHFEGMPRCIVEILSVGRPVVTTNFTGINELVNDRVNGFVSKSRDPHIIANMIIEVWGYIQQNKFEPTAISATVEKYSPSIQLKKVFSVIDSTGV